MFKQNINRFFKLFFFFASFFCVFAQENIKSTIESSQEKTSKEDMDRSELNELEAILKNLESDETEKKKTTSFFKKDLHRFEGGINDLAIEYNRQKSFYIVGEDGFVSKVSLPNFETETWQLSDLAIKKIATHPDGVTISIYESNGVGLHKISVWNWERKERIFIIRPNYLVTSLSWSANGNYLLVGNVENGIEIFDKKGGLIPIYSTSPGIVLLATTGKREKSIVTYSKNGKLNYTSLKDKKKLAEYKTIPALDSPKIIKNYTRIVGYSNGNVQILNAYTGKILETYNSQNAIFACHKESEDAIWLENSEKNNFFLHINGKKSSSFALTTQANITSSISINNFQIILGMSDGTLQLLTYEKGFIHCKNLFEYKNYEKIKDIAVGDEDLFILKENLISKKNGIKGEEIPIKTGINCDSMICEGGNLILWRKNEKNEIYNYSLLQKKISTIYKPKTEVKFCSTRKGQLLVIESSCLISVISIEDGKLIFSHVVEGAESALQRNASHIIITKNTLDTTASPLLELNMQTKEIAPIKLTGDFAFSLTASKELLNTFFCFLLNEGKKRSTNLIQFATEENRILSGKFEKLLTYEDEDFSSFILSTKDAILTNLGKDVLLYFKLYEKSLFKLERFHAFPKKAVIFAGNIVVLGTDGTIALYNQNTLKLEKY